MSIVRLMLCLAAAIYLCTCAAVMAVVMPPLTQHLHQEQALRAQAQALAFAKDVASGAIAPEQLDAQLAARAKQEGWLKASVQRQPTAAAAAASAAETPGEAHVALMQSGQALGVLSLSVSDHASEALVKRVQWGMLIAFAVLGVAMLVALWRLASWGRQPLVGFDEQIRGLTEGRFVSMHEPKVTEWVELSKSLNVMVSRVGLMLKERDQLVHSYQNRLAHDALTQTSSRDHFMDQVKQALAGTAGHGALAIVRLHDLEGLNRRLGRARTDDFLVSFATTLRTKLTQLAGEQEHVLARLNGADFGVLFGIDSLERLKEHLAVLAKALSGLAAEGFTESPFVAWIGGSTIRSGEVLGDVLSRVDGMVGASATQRVAFCVTEPSARHFNIAIAQWRIIIENALDTGRFKLQFHPVLDGRGELIHEEAMLRLIEPSGELMTASDFIPPAVRSGRVSALDQKALELALSALAERPGKIAINVSPQSLLHPMFMRRLVELLKENAELAERLCFEVRELDVFDEDWHAAMTLCRTVEPFGCQVGIDHFGTTLSVLPLIDRGRIDYVKLAPKLVERAAHDEPVRAYLEVLMALALKQGVRVMGNGVRSAAEMEALKSVGIDAFTGPGVVWDGAALAV